MKEYHIWRHTDRSTAQRVLQSVRIRHAGRRVHQWISLHSSFQSTGTTL